MATNETSIMSKMVNLAGDIASQVEDEFAPLVAARDSIRENLLEKGEIVQFPKDLDNSPKSMCAVDGARIREQMYAVDLIYAAASAGNAHFSEEKLEVESKVWAKVMKHMDGTEAIAQTAMGALEVSVASDAPHEIVALDGSFVTPLISLQAALFSGNMEVRDVAASILFDEHIMPLKALEKLISKPAGSLIALTKSDSSVYYVKNFEERFEVKLGVADRVLASQILKPGEVLMPRKLIELGKHSMNEVKGSAKVRKAGEELTSVVHKLNSMAYGGRAHTTYFKPYGAHTVIRFEFFTEETDNGTILAEASRIASIINADTKPPHLLEPFCQYVVDKEVKTISVGARALKEKMLTMLPVDDASSYRLLLAEGYRT